MQKYYTTQEAAAILGKKPASLDIDRFRGVGPRFVRAGRRILYPESELQSYLESLPRLRSTSEKG
jgi:hypothetical protein